MVETQPMRGLYLESTENKKHERLHEVVSQWLNCQILSNLPMVAANNTYYDAANMVWEWVRPDNILITLLNYFLPFI